MAMNATEIHDPLYGTGRTAAEQATANLAEALRAMSLLPMATTDLIPHPLVVARAEIENARRYLGLLSPSDTSRRAMGREHKDRTCGVPDRRG